MEARDDAQPPDYRIVYAEIMQYMWKFTSGDGMDIVATLKDVLGLFETCAAGASSMDVTGADVTAFCDERLRGTRSHIDKWRESLNRDVLRQLGHAGPQD
jgi:DNA-binding ferritin-like protein (Dps family)